MQNVHSSRKKREIRKWNGDKLCFQRDKQFEEKSDIT